VIGGAVESFSNIASVKEKVLRQAKSELDPMLLPKNCTFKKK
jgi:hypothetical protein